MVNFQPLQVVWKTLKKSTKQWQNNQNNDDYDNLQWKKNQTKLGENVHCTLKEGGGKFGRERGEGGGGRIKGMFIKKSAWKWDPCCFRKWYHCIKKKEKQKNKTKKPGAHAIGSWNDVWSPKRQVYMSSIKSLSSLWDPGVCMSQNETKWCSSCAYQRHVLNSFITNVGHGWKKKEVDFHMLSKGTVNLNRMSDWLAFLFNISHQIWSAHVYNTTDGRWYNKTIRSFYKGPSEPVLV